MASLFMKEHDHIVPCIILISCNEKYGRSISAILDFDFIKHITICIEHVSYKHFMHLIIKCPGGGKSSCINFIPIVSECNKVVSDIWAKFSFLLIYKRLVKHSFPTANMLGNSFTQRWVKNQQSKLLGNI